VYQALEQRRNRLGWERPIAAFESRMHWHCHFIQKFEMECRMEFEDLNRGYREMPRPVDAPDHLVHRPWDANPMERALQPATYPDPIVDCRDTFRRARETLWHMRDLPSLKAEAERILARHVERRPHLGGGRQA
jgi:deoxyribodipyrimidine photolyase